MKRSGFSHVTVTGRGGVPAGACLVNRWSDEARAAALAVRRAKAALRQAQDRAAGRADVSAINLAPDGKTYVGFTDGSVEPPRNHYLPVGGGEDGWRVVSADYDSEEVVLEKDGVRIALKLGGGGGSALVPDFGSALVGETEGGGSSLVRKFDSALVDDAGTAEDGGGDVDLGGAWEDFQESGIWSMAGRNREEILADIRERYEKEGDAALENGERKFLEQYGKFESVRDMAGMIVEGGGGEPQPFAETQARLRAALEDPAATGEGRDEAHLVYRAEIEAARRIWEAKAGQAFYTRYGRSADTGEEALEGERLAGVPPEYAGALADGYLENRRGRKRRRRALANRVEEEARGRLANTGWTDEARAASLAVRRGTAAGKRLAAPGPAGKSGGTPGGSSIAPKRWPGVTPPPGIRAPAPEDEAKLGNPDTEYEGMRIRGPGGSFEVRDGVLRRVWGVGTGAYGDVAARMFKTVLTKMAAAGVDVINGMGKMPDFMRPYAEGYYGVKKRPPIQY